MARPKGKESATQSKRGATKVSSPVNSKKKRKKKVSPSSSASRGQSQSCHQCRQSIHSSKGVSEVKSGKERLKCSQCTRFWCEQCLHNRYGIIKADMDPSSWICPVCSKKCNCSLCRRKEGKLATGILTPLVKNAGFDSVSEFLDKGTDDIAKVLQWKSPESAGVDPSSERSSTTAASKGQKSKPKRSSRTSDHENSKSLANGTKSKSGTPDTCDRPSNSTGSHSDSPSCHSNEPDCHSNRRPKRRKLTHSTYSITIEEDSIETSDSTKVNPTDTQSCQSPSIDPRTKDEDSPLTPPGNQNEDQFTPCEMDTHCRRSARLSKRRSTTVSSDLTSPVSQSESESVRRSPRKRKITSRYLSDDFRTDRDLNGSSTNDQGSPLSNNNEVNPQSPSNTTHNSQGEIIYREDLKEELEMLRASRMELMRSSKACERQKILEEKATQRDEIRKIKCEERAKDLEEKKRANEEKKLSRIVAQEKLKLARNLLKEAQRDVKRRQKEREKLKKQKELRKLKENKQNERKRMQELVSVSFIGTSNESKVSLVEDSPDHCKEAGIRPLPELPQMELSIHHHLLPQLFFVSEFLFIFADAFNLRRRLEGRELCRLLAGGRGLGEVYLRLLKVLLEEEEIDDYGELKPSKSQRDLQQVARRYLHDNGRNGFIDGHFDEQSLEESLVILHHLCEEALDTMAISDHMTALCEQSSVLRKEQRVKEKEMSIKISDELKQLCERQGCSLDQVEAKRKEFTSELWERRKKAEWEQYKCGLVMRNECLGRDRHDRVFWKLQSVPGVLVEVEESNEASSRWLVINSVQLMEDFIDCLHPTGRREKLLMDALTFHKPSLEAGLVNRGIKKFYGK